MTGKPFVFSILFILSAAAQAQQFQGGLMGGVVASQVAGDTYSGYDKAGVFAGGFVALPLDERWRVQMELAYIQKGSRNNYDPDVPDDIDYLFRASYVEMPLLLQYDMSVFINHLTVQAGLGYGVLVAHKELRNDEDIKSQQPKVKSGSLSFIAGLNYEIGQRWKIDFRTDNSLFNIRDGKRQGYVRRLSKEYGQYHDVLIISLFYRL